MVYKEKASAVIMLTELSDGGQEQSVKYWPDNINEWNEWKTNQGQMVINQAEITAPIAVLNMEQSVPWQGAEQLVTKRSIAVFSSSNPAVSHFVIRFFAFRISMLINIIGNPPG